MWNAENGVRFYRVSSGLLPWVVGGGYQLEDLPLYEVIAGDAGPAGLGSTQELTTGSVVWEVDTTLPVAREEQGMGKGERGHSFVFFYSRGGTCGRCGHCGSICLGGCCGSALPPPQPKF